jgi:hypothetical protein
MKGDFARVTFDPARHYSQVFQQQGRVLLDADWNEQGAIQLHLLRTLAADLLGHCWAAGNGFAITRSTTNANGATTPLPLTDWSLAPGHFYVDGILCVNESAITLATQPGAPTPDYGVADGKSGFENPPAAFVLWLDVWERHLSWVEAPAINDVALNGVDTASRRQVVWQLRMLDKPRLGQQLTNVQNALALRLKATTDSVAVAAIKQQQTELATLRRALDGSSGDPCTLLREALEARQRYALPRLRAHLQPAESDNDPCVIAADASYRGCENQLYRVEVHQPGAAVAAGTAASTATASFKWSRENGSVIFPISGAIAATAADDGSTQLNVPLTRLGRDARLGVVVDDWVELVDDNYTLAQRAFALLQVVAVDLPGRSVTLNVPRNVVRYQPDPARHPLLRRWDQRDGLDAQAAVPLLEDTDLLLEDGVEIRFESGGVYANGDYWVIPARVADSGQLDWPQEPGADGKPVAAAVRADGLHHYAVLGTADEQNPYAECCCRFDSLCALLKKDTVTTRGDAVLAPAAGAPAKLASPTTKKTPTRKAATTKTVRKATTKGRQP